MRSPIFDHLSLVYLPSGVYPRNVYHNRSLCSVRKFRAPREHFTNSRTRLNALSVRSVINDTLDSMLLFSCLFLFLSLHIVTLCNSSYTKLFHPVISHSSPRVYCHNSPSYLVLALTSCSLWLTFLLSPVQTVSVESDPPLYSLDPTRKLHGP